MALTLCINLILTMSFEMLNKGFELELYSLPEIPMVCNYLKFVCQMILYNVRAMLVAMFEDLMKLNLINFDEIDESPSKFKQRRKRATPV